MTLNLFDPISDAPAKKKVEAKKIEKKIQTITKAEPKKVNIADYAKAFKTAIETEPVQHHANILAALKIPLLDENADIYDSSRQTFSDLPLAMKVYLSLWVQGKDQLIMTTVRTLDITSLNYTGLKRLMLLAAKSDLKCLTELINKKQQF